MTIQGILCRSHMSFSTAFNQTKNMYRREHQTQNVYAWDASVNIIAEISQHRITLRDSCSLVFLGIPVQTRAWSFLQWTEQKKSFPCLSRFYNFFLTWIAFLPKLELLWYQISQQVESSLPFQLRSSWTRPETRTRQHEKIPSVLTNEHVSFSREEKWMESGKSNVHKGPLFRQ